LAHLLGQVYEPIELAECSGELATLEFARKQAAHFLPGQRIALTGDLGAGKTTWVRGLAETLGLHHRVHSPTYALIHSYGDPPRLHHLDLYRLAPGTDWNELGLEDLFDTEALTCVEWPERLPEGTRFQHWVDIQYVRQPHGSEKSLAEMSPHQEQTETRLIRWLRPLEVARA
jgi:tRNA threonylcarbamoyl adenosine modification protein YjeE